MVNRPKIKRKYVKKICVLGLGYIGLPTSIILAENDFDVVGFDIDINKVERINNFDPIIQEPEISSKLKKVLSEKKFKAVKKIESADYFIIAVPTPFKVTDNLEKQADLSYVWATIEFISQVLKIGDTVILESTVPVGTTEELARKLELSANLKAGKDFFVAYCPERVFPGKIFYELENNSRVLGGINSSSAQKAQELYVKFVKGDLHLESSTFAEMIKLVENSSRDAQIAIANQVASLAYKVGIDPYKLISIANEHPRVKILNPTCGVGGHCIAVDPWFLVESFPEQTELFKKSRQINDSKPYQVLTFIKDAISKWKLSKPNSKCKVAVLGLTYKPNVDDLRESPALLIAQELNKINEIDFVAVEPYIEPEILNKKYNIKTERLEPALSDSNIIVCLVAHNYFKNLKNILNKDQIILDFCGLMYEKKEVNTLGNRKKLKHADTANLSPRSW